MRTNSARRSGMRLGECLELAARSLSESGTRSALTAFGFVVGTATIVLVAALGAGAGRFVDEQFRGLGDRLVTVFDGGPREVGRVPLTLQDAQAVRESPSVAEVAPVVYTQGTVNVGGRFARVQVQGVAPAAVALTRIALASGRYFSLEEVSGRARVTILGLGLAGRLFGGTDACGQSVLLDGQPLVVIGVARPGFFGGYLDLDRGMLVSLPLALEAFVPRKAMGERISGILVQTREHSSIEEATFELRNLLQQRHRVDGPEDFLISSLQQQQQLIRQVVLGASAVLGLAATLSLLVGGIGVTNIMFASVAERRGEIGLRRALGARRSDIRAQFLFEALMLSVVASLVGLILGWVAIRVVGAFLPFEPVAPLWSLGLAVALGAGAGAVSGTLPARRAARLDPAQALRSFHS